jgi:hypothetical protein
VSPGLGTTPEAMLHRKLLMGVFFYETLFLSLSSACLGGTKTGGQPALPVSSHRFGTATLG